MLSEGGDNLRRFSQSRQTLHKLLQTHLVHPRQLFSSARKERENASNCLLQLFQAHMDCINPIILGLYNTFKS